MPKVSFITVNYKTPHFIRHLLSGIEAAKLSFPFEYFIVDNGSRDGTPDMVRERFPWARVIESENRGFGAGNNLAMREARGEYVILLNPDLTVFPGEIDAWVRWMDQRPDVGLSGPRTLNPDGSDQRSTYRFPKMMVPVYRRTALGQTSWGKKMLAQYLMHDMDRSREQDVDWTQGSAMCIRRSVLEQVGHFDDQFFMYFEDTDLCRRVWEAGHRVAYTPEARVVHYLQRESRIRYPWEVFTNRVTRAHIDSAIKYFAKYRGRKNPRQVK